MEGKVKWQETIRTLTKLRESTRTIKRALNEALKRLDEFADKYPLYKNGGEND